MSLYRFAFSESCLSCAKKASREPYHLSRIKTEHLLYSKCPVLSYSHLSKVTNYERMKPALIIYLQEF